MSIDLDQLRAESAALSDSHAPKTRASYRLDWRSFTAWCARVDRAPLPASTDTTILYLTHLLHTHKVSTARRHAASINAQHSEAGLARPADHRVSAVLNGAQRARGEQPHQMRGLTVDELRQIVTGDMAGSIPYQTRNRALLLVGFASGFRRSTLAALDLADIAFEEQGLILQVRKEKQDRKGAGRASGIAKGEHPETCPVRALKEWIRLRRSDPGPLFTPVINGCIQADRRLNPASINEVVKESVEGIGLDRKLFSAHSLRRGLISESLLRGVDSLVLAGHTGHRSLSSLRRYFQRNTPWRENPTSQIGL